MPADRHPRPPRHAGRRGPRAVVGAVTLAALAATSGALARPAAPPVTVRGIDPPAGLGAMAPNVSVDPAVAGGAVRLSWLEDDPGPSRQRLCHARFVDGAWSTARVIVARDDFFANWADLPSVVGTADGTLYAHWLQRTGEATYAYAVMIALSRDGGATWGMLGPVHDDGTPTEHGFVSMLPEAGGVRVFWLDGREMAGGDAHDPDPPGHGGNMMLRTALVTDRVGPSEVLDHRVCECCGTAAARTPAGALVTYRDRSMEEERDVFLVRAGDDGWSKPRPVHHDGWEIAACPVNGPSAAAHGDRVAIAWYTGAAHRPRVRVAFSRDGGRRFDPPLTLDDEEPIGRVALVMDDRGVATVAWLAPLGDGAQIRLVTIGPDGVATAPITVARTAATRAAGFPRLARMPVGVLVAWTEPGMASRIRAAIVQGERIEGRRD